MPLLARYTSPFGLDLCDIETGATLLHIPKQADSRRSLQWIAENYAAQEGHHIAEWDRSNLTKETL